jgi:branched-chain amino acid transport system permease protein
MKQFSITLVVFVSGFIVPIVGSRFYTFVATDIVILALFAMSANLLMGVTGLVSFGHAAYFAIGAYTCAIVTKEFGYPFFAGFLLAGVSATAAAIFFGYFCARLTQIYFAMLTLAFAQIVWAICFKWNDVTGGEQGLPNVPTPDLSWFGPVPWLGTLRASDQFYLVVLTLVALCISALQRISASPFGRVLTMIRENSERAEFVGINVRLYKTAAFALAGTFAGLAGALFGVFNRGVFPDYAYWTKSAEVLIMALLGGMGQFWGPAIGALVLSVVRQETGELTQYWPMILGLVLAFLLFAFPKGILGTLAPLALRARKRREMRRVQADA